jgi:hypothetical protein
MEAWEDEEEEDDKVYFLLLILILKSLFRNTADITPAKDEPAMKRISADIV